MRANQYPLYAVWLPDGTLMTYEGDMAWPFSVAQRHAKDTGGTVREQFT